MEKIYMIPVNDAYNESCGCPICRLRDKAEKRSPIRLAFALFIWAS